MGNTAPGQLPDIHPEDADRIFADPEADFAPVEKEGEQTREAASVLMGEGRQMSEEEFLARMRDAAEAERDPRTFHPRIWDAFGAEIDSPQNPIPPSAFLQRK